MVIIQTHCEFKIMTEDNQQTSSYVDPPLPPPLSPLYMRRKGGVDKKGPFRFLK